MVTRTITLNDFLKSYASRPNRFAWLLGAGASRNAGMPSADDLVWELKLQLYCRNERQDVARHDLANKAVRARIQQYFDSKHAPARYDSLEYSYFFELAFGTDYAAQQRFLDEELKTDKLSLNGGNRVLAALIAMGAANVVFTTNFDTVLEQAYAEVAGKVLPTFHLEGSVAALDALNADSFPIYVKLHGDFRYRSIKNLSEDLKANDKMLGTTFLAASNRFGMVVTGYSGRDANVMSMFHAALQQPNPFPGGLYWCVTKASDCAAPVKDLIDAAAARGVDAAVVETGTFDILMSNLWPQIPNRPNSLNAKVRPHRASAVSIPVPSPGRAYPLLRTNALPVTGLPTACGKLVCTPLPTYDQIRKAQGDIIPEAIYTLTDSLLYWGATAEVTGFVPCDGVKHSTSQSFPDPQAELSQATVIKGFFEQALAKALCEGKPLVLRRKGRALYAVASNRPEDRPLLRDLALAVGGNERAFVSGAVPNQQSKWAEAVTIRLKERAGKLFLLLEPAIWITPLKAREAASVFMRGKRLKRYNQQANRILNAWIALLLGKVGNGNLVSVTAFPETEFPATFQISTRTAFSGQEVSGGA